MLIHLEFFFKHGMGRQCIFFFFHKNNHFQAVFMDSLSFSHNATSVMYISNIYGQTMGS